MIDSNGNEFPPCIWCGMDEMDSQASFNGGDICVYCEEDFLAQENEEENEEDNE